MSETPRTASALRRLDKPIRRMTRLAPPTDYTTATSDMARALRGNRLSLLAALARDFDGRADDPAIDSAAAKLADAADAGHVGVCLATLVDLATACDRRTVVARRAA